jgi:hypothetical protein
MIERADKWTPPDSLGYSSLRAIRLTRKGKAVIVIAVAILIGATVLGIFLARKVQREAAERTLLRDQGIAADAVVTRVWRGGGKEDEHRVTYRFAYDGKVYTRTVRTPVSIWRTLAPGADLPVRFVASRPTISHPVAWPFTGLPPWFPYLLAAMCTVPAFLLPIPVRREARLLTEGRPAPGRVTGFKKVDKAIRVVYEFRLLNGTVVKGKVNRSKPPIEGTTVCVLYDPENPRRNALYPFSLVRLENVPTRPYKN